MSMINKEVSDFRTYASSLCGRWSQLPATALWPRQSWKNM